VQEGARRDGRRFGRRGGIDAQERLAKATRRRRGGAEGTVAVERSGLSAVLVEVNCETDFVARGDEFQASPAMSRERRSTRRLRT